MLNQQTVNLQILTIIALCLKRRFEAGLTGFSETVSEVYFYISFSDDKSAATIHFHNSETERRTPAQIEEALKVLTPKILNDYEYVKCYQNYFGQAVEQFTISF